MKRVFLALSMLLATFLAPAQTAPALSDATQSTALQPFAATYAVHRTGKPFGDATLQLVHLGDARWRVDLGIRGTRGFIGLAGLNLQQSTLFEVSGDQYRPLSQSTVRKAVIGSRRTTGVYDWAGTRRSGRAMSRKPGAARCALQDGDMSGLLINLAVLRDAKPGTTLRYRFVDDGRVRDHHYAVASEREPVTVDELGYNAMRVTRSKQAGEETILWVVEGVPMPIRILQRENGEDALDLRLMEYNGA